MTLCNHDAASEEALVLCRKFHQGIRIEMLLCRLKLEIRTGRRTDFNRDNGLKLFYGLAKSSGL